jgi:hypothetical protein
VKKAAIFSLAFSAVVGVMGFVLTSNAAATNSVQSLWSGGVPANSRASDPKSVNLGLKFHSTVSGRILGIRFYKGRDNTGTHVGSLWSPSGKLLSSVTFTDETATGWQVANFAAPVDIAASTTYEVSYLAPHGHYSYDYNYFTSAHGSGNLVADQATAQAGNGVYLYSGNAARPATPAPRATNYWVDVLFQPNTGAASSAAASPSPSAATGGTASAQPSVTASKTAGSSSPSASAQTTTAAPAVTVTGTRAAGSYVKPGSVGYLGNTSALTVYAPGGAAPGGCSWLSYGLRCDQTNLTLDHVWIKGSLYWTGTGDLTVSQSIVQGGTGTSWYAILGHPASSGALDSTIKVTDSTVGWLPGQTMPAGYDVAPIWSAYGNQAEVAIRDDLSGMPQGIDPTGGSVIQDDWIHDLVQTGTSSAPTHLDGIFSQGGGDIKIDGNYVDVPVRSDTTAAVFIQDLGSTDTGISITNNYLSGGAFTLRDQTGINVDVENNTFAQSVWGPVGDLTGYPGTYGTWAGNVSLSGSLIAKP